MLSLIHHEVVVQHGWITSAALSDIIAISQMTPGPIAINSATYIGYTVAGFWGSVIATISVCLPSLTIMVLITRFFLKLKDSPYMSRVMTTMRPAVIGMIGAASMLLIFPDDSQGASMIDVWSWVLFAAAFVASLKRVNPIKLIVLSAVAGIAIYYVPTLLGDKDNELSPLEQKTQQQWQDFSMASVESISSPHFEQAWVDYIWDLQHQNPQWAAKQLKATMDLISPSAEALEAFFDLSERYLYDPNSPMRNDELFIPILERFIADLQIAPELKMRPEALLKMAQLNRVGTVASDFQLDDGRRLHQVEAPFTLLYFHDPDCGDCKRVGSIIEGSALLGEMEQQRAVSVVKVMASGNEQLDSLYDLKAIPTLYLLDEQKRVLLKDTSIEIILNSLSIKNNQ